MRRGQGGSGRQGAMGQPPNTGDGHRNVFSSFFAYNSEVRSVRLVIVNCASARFAGGSDARSFEFPSHQLRGGEGALQRSPGV